MYKVYASAQYRSYIRPLLEDGWLEAKTIEEADAVTFAGGEDINPALYGQRPGSFTYWNDRRDDVELRDVAYCREHGIPMFGICRGMQLLTAIAGGTLIQDVGNHTRRHEMIMSNGKVIVVNSLHHQMCNPFNLREDQYKLLGWARDWGTGFLGEDDKPLVSGPPTIEPEAIYYPELKAFAVQYHPEMMASDSEGTRFYVDHCNKLMKDGSL